MTQTKTCRNEDVSRKNTNENEVIEGFGVRHVLAILGFLGFTCAYVLRNNLSVAIVAMVNNTSPSATQNDTANGQCPYPDDYDPNESTYSGGEFDWDASTQGIILGSFYYGYICTCLLGGLAAERFGGCVVMGYGIMITSLLTLLSPMANRASVRVFVALRIMEGLAEGVTFPAMNYLIARWYPKEERSKFAGLIFSGVHFGTVVVMPVTGWLCGNSFLGGWPASFYIFGYVGIIWSLAWFLFARDDPRQHPRISSRELAYITNGCGDFKEWAPVPWKAILTSRYFWTIAVLHFGNNWGFYTLLTELPTYFDQILHVNITKNGLLSSLPYLAGWLLCIIFSVVTGRFTTNGSLSILALRRIAAAIGGYGPMLALIAMCFVDCHRTLALIVLIIGGSFSGTTNLGHMGSHADISPRFAGTLMGMTNTFGTIPGFLAPIVTGAITEGNQNIYAWRKVFLLSAIIYGVTVTIYIVSYRAEIQPWNELKTDRRGSLEKRNVKSTVVSEVWRPL